ncbi:hypothetical protein HF521_006916, partial [Silurus meridionalis]
IESVRSAYFSQIIDNNQSNPRHLFNTINRLLKVNVGTSLPVSNQLCKDFLNFFSSKIDNVYKLIHAAPASSSIFCSPSFSGTPFSTFSQIDTELLTREVSRMKVTTCLLDPLPTSLFKSCLDSLCPAVLSIVNDSLLTGVVPAALKTAAVTPVLKKQNSDLDNLNNYCPISNLPFFAKILERLVALQPHSHLT